MTASKIDQFIFVKEEKKTNKTRLKDCKMCFTIGFIIVTVFSYQVKIQSRERKIF